MSDCPDLRGIVLDAARLSEIRDLLTYESSISFHSNRAHKSMWLLHAEIERLTAELALKDQALDEIKALHVETPCLCGPFGNPSGHPSCAACADDDWPCETQRILTRLDTQGETK